jgi:hypothetical protein
MSTSPYVGAMSRWNQAEDCRTRRCGVETNRDYWRNLRLVHVNSVNAWSGKLENPGPRCRRVRARLEVEMYVYSYLQIDRPESIFVHSPLLFSCGAGQTTGSRLLRYFVGEIPQNGLELRNVYDMVCGSFDAVSDTPLSSLLVIPVQLSITNSSWYVQHCLCYFGSCQHELNISTCMLHSGLATWSLVWHLSRLLKCFTWWCQDDLTDTVPQSPMANLYKTCPSSECKNHLNHTDMW